MIFIKLCALTDVYVLRYTGSDMSWAKSYKLAGFIANGKWNLGSSKEYYHGQHEKRMPIAITASPWEIDELLVAKPWIIR